MSKTNSNSITSLLVAALNAESFFRKQTLDLFSKKIGRKISSDIRFYDCTHTPLLYEEMNGKEIDIIARVQGEHKPKMMIEVKASVGENLQESQSIGGEYENTSINHDIPLIYIIPQYYNHEDELPKNAKIIYWTEILNKIDDFNVKFDAQIRKFVEINDESKQFEEDEKQLFVNKSLLIRIRNSKERVIKMIWDLLGSLHRQNINPQEDEWGVGYYYTYNKTDCFVGFNPFDDDKFLSMAIAENVKNVELGDRKDNPLDFYEGWYYNPILNKQNCLDIDEKVLSSLRQQLSDFEIGKEVQANFFHFFALRSKITPDDFDKIFNMVFDDKGNVNGYEINDKEYEKLPNKYFE